MRISSDRSFAQPASIGNLTFAQTRVLNRAGWFWFIAVALIILQLTLPQSGATQEADGPSKLAWNRNDRYVAPDFENYFSENDQAAGIKLKEFYANSQLRQQQPDDYINAVRRGLRSFDGHKTLVLSQLGNHFIWTRDPQNDLAIELMYHAAGSDDHNVRHYAMYFGCTVVKDRTPNLMRMMMQNQHLFGHDIRRRLYWSFETIGDPGQTADLLVDLLEKHEQIDESTIIASCDYYQRLTGRLPPHYDQFKTLGMWAVAFSHADVGLDQPDGFQQLRDMIGQHLELPESDLIEYAPRVHQDRWVGVMLVSGFGLKDELVRRVESTEGFQLEFADRVDEEFFQSRRIAEFAAHVDVAPGGKLPKYSLPQRDRVFSWNRTDRYDPPDFEAFFPIDPDAGKRLDEVLKDGKLGELSDQEFLVLFRNGVRTSDSNGNHLFGQFASALGWPEDPFHKEILYQASALNAPEGIRKAAVYYGLGTWWKKSDNVLKLFADILAHPTDTFPANSNHSRIVWSLREDWGEKESVASFLRENLVRDADQLDDTTIARILVMIRELTDRKPVVPAGLADRGLFLVVARGNDFSSVQKFEGWHRAIRDRWRLTEKSSYFEARKMGDEVGGYWVLYGFDTFDQVRDVLSTTDEIQLLYAGPWDRPRTVSQQGLPGTTEIDRLLRQGN